MKVNEMKRKDFEGLPHRNWSEDVIFDSMVIMPGKANDLHDSGYRCMDFVAVVKGEAICLLSGGSDVINLDGIGGYGKDWLTKNEGVPNMVPIAGWSIDCLPKSGLLRIFCNKYMECDPALSSFSVYATTDK